MNLPNIGQVGAADQVGSVGLRRTLKPRLTMPHPLRMKLPTPKVPTIAQPKMGRTALLNGLKG